MKLGNRKVKNCALAGALALMMGAMAWAQPAQPDLLRLSYYKVRSSGTYDYQEGMKLINEGYKKAGVPWRRAWTMTMFGETYTGVMATPVKNFAQFDNPGPMTGLSTTDNIKIQTLMRNAVESSRHVLVRFAPELSLYPGPLPEKTFGRMMTVRVKPGKTVEYEDLVKTMLLPALKQAGIKDFRVNRVILGSAAGEYVTLIPFAKWSELDGWPTTEKLMGASYKAYLARIAETVDSAETQVMTTVPELGFVSQ